MRRSIKNVNPGLKPVPGATGDNKPFSVVRREVRGGKEKILIPASELVSSFTRNNLASAVVYALPPQKKDLRTKNLCSSLSTNQVLSYPELNKMLWLKKELKGESCVYSLVVFDLKTLEKRVVKSDALPPLQVNDSSRFRPLLGLTPDGQRMVCQNAMEIFTIDLISGEKNLLAETSDINSGFIFLSPGYDKVVVVKVDYDYDSRTRTNYITIYDKGEIIHKTSYLKKTMVPTWIDNDRVALVMEDKIIEINTDGGGNRQIYPKP